MPTIIPRTQVGLPARVANIDKISSRPLLQRRLGLVVVHYTGARASYAGKDIASAIRSIHRWRANEYNYVIALDGTIVEFAGAYQAAHCKGRNASSYGVLFLNGIPDVATDAQVDSYRWLIGCLKWTQAISPNAWQVQHGQVAATDCPGPVKQRWAELVAQ